MQYQEAIDYLFSRLPMFSRTGGAAYKPGLETSIKLAEFFNNPHQKFKSIHIGGTNGKGSTSHLISSILQSQGYKVGLYTSPHLVDFRERMKINGEMISKNHVVDFVERWRESGYEGQPSFFELTMIMAFDWFARNEVDVAVIEVGMGGRLDSTNIITPILSIITNISYDHNQFLGETLEEIAGEKAGIIKKQVPVVIGETQKETENIFKQKAIKENSPISFADQECKGIEIFSTESGWNCRIGDFEFNLPLGGEYQKKNIVTVMCAVEKLKSIGLNIEEDCIEKGIENVCAYTGLMGRWSILNETPLVIADTGHNIAGIKYNVTQLKELMKNRTDSKMRIVIGFVADKAIDKILSILPKDALYYVTNAQIPRALPAAELNKIMQEKGFHTKKYDNVFNAYSSAKDEASEKDIIFIGGSTFIVADLLSQRI